MDDMNRVIEAARLVPEQTLILPGVPPPMRVVVKYEGEPDEGMLFTYFADELTFRPEELVGLTKRQALALWMQRDTEYLRS